MNPVSGKLFVKFGKSGPFFSWAQRELRSSLGLLGGFNALREFDLPQYGGNGATLAELGIKSISLHYVKCAAGCTDGHGNDLRYVTTVEMENPSANVVEAVDVVFRYVLPTVQ